MEFVEVVSPVLGARCTVVVSGPACVIVDPGARVADDVLATVAAHGLVVHGILLTHGHADHTWDAGPLAAALDVAVHVHAADRYRLDDPFGTLGVLGAVPPGGEGALAQVLRQAGVDPGGYLPPDRVATFGDEPGPHGRSPDARLELGPLTVVARHAPGHTEGSTIYLLDDAATALTGDVLFAGTIGRTDLPGGDDLVMARTLREVIATLPPGTRLLPGHGPASDLHTELRHNPFLQ